MKILAVGATGGTGRHVGGQALEAGHDVTVFARDPAKMALAGMAAFPAPMSRNSF